MIQITKICDALQSLVGFRQGYNSTDAVLPDYLTSSESGMYFQSMHTLLTIPNLMAIAPSFDSEVEYDPKDNYLQGAYVSYENVRYRAIQDSRGKQPDTENAYWAQEDSFATWLKDKVRDSISSMVNRLCTEKIAMGTMKSLCENKVLFDGTGRIYDTIKNTKNLVGFEIVPNRAIGVTTKIQRIGLQFTKAGKYKVYLMQSGSSTPIKVFDFTKKLDNSMEWFTIKDCYLPYRGDTIDAGGSWYLCYSQSELPEGSEAISKDYDWSKAPCQGCSRINFSLWNAWSRYLEVHPFAVNEELLQGSSFNPDYNTDFDKVPLRMWDVENNIYRTDTNYGLNIEVSVGCDISDFIIDQRLSFANLLGLQFAVDMLREMAYNSNVRLNQNVLNVSRMELLYELDGDSSSLKKSGLAYKLDNAYKAAELSLKGMSRVCLPCKNYGIKYTTV